LYGEWLPWLKANVRFSRQAADNYRRVAQEWDKLLSVGNLSLRDALRILASDGEEEQEPEPDKVEPERIEVVDETNTIASTSNASTVETNTVSVPNSEAA
jgi:hypothetical protein